MTFGHTIYNKSSFFLSLQFVGKSVKYKHDFVPESHILKEDLMSKVHVFIHYLDKY